MSDPKKELIPDTAARFLNLRHHPARSDVSQAAVLLGFHHDHIRIFVAEGELTPLGDPAPNGPKMFATDYVKAKGADLKWLHKTNCLIQRSNRQKNSKHQPDLNPL